MKSLIRHTTFRILCLSISVASVSATLPKSSQSVHQFSVGAEGFYYDYREPQLMESKGALFGLNAAYNYTFGPDFFVQPDLRFAYGQTNYKSHGTGSMKHEPNWLFETRVILGKRFCIAAQTQLDPYIGLGYRWKDDDTNGMETTTGHVGYFRRSQYFYAPIGLTVHQGVGCGWSLAPTVEFDLFIRGRQRSDILDNGGAVHNTQKKGYGLRGDFMINKQFTKSSISFGPFINYWNIDDSDVVMGGLEPHNKTIETGLKIKFNF